MAQDNGGEAEPEAQQEQEQPTPAASAFIISADLANATLNYLIDQPYRQVAQLVAGFTGLVPVPEQPVEQPNRKERRATARR